MAELNKGVSLNEVGYWSQVVLKGLEDQRRLLKRAEPTLKKMDTDECARLCRSGYRKIQRAFSEGSIEPLRELKTLEKGAIAKQVQSVGDVFVSMLPIPRY